MGFGGLGVLDVAGLRVRLAIRWEEACELVVGIDEGNLLESSIFSHNPFVWYVLRKGVEEGIHILCLVYGSLCRELYHKS